MDKKKKNILSISIISIILILILAIIGGTTSFFGWRAEKEATVDVTIAGGEGECALKYDNNRFIEPSLTKNSGRIIKLKASQSMGGKASIAWNMNIKSIGGLKDASFKYEMINSSTGISYGSGDFKNAYSGSTITFSTTEEVLGFGLEYEFTLYLWIDGTFGNYQSVMADDTLDFDISCNLVSTETGTVYEPQITLDETAAGHIQKLYDDANKTLITQENSGDQYNYATSVNLMNDGLGTGNNIRYYGNSPDNYIYFNCSDYSNQTAETCEIWRIVGVFDGKVKIVRQDPIGDYSWDYTSTGESEANWHDATIMTLLNNGYYNNSNNATYYNNSTTPITVDFATSGIGLKNEKTRNMISESTWYLGAWDKGNIYPDLVYGYERGYEKCATCTGESTWTGKLALLYASDYGYAADLRYCDTDMNNYQISECISNNWLFKSGYMTFINSHFGFSNFVWGQRPIGHIRTGTRTDIPHPIYPTLYLDTNIAFNTIGNGTSSNPYQLAVQTQIEYVDFEITQENRHMIGYTDTTTELNIPTIFQGEDGTWYKVTSLALAAFNDCTNLTSVTIPKSVALIGDATFSGCTNLTSVTILNGVTSIGVGAFSRCTSLTNVIIPISVTFIDLSAFGGCTALTDVYYTGRESDWNSIYIAEEFDGNAPLLNATKHYNHVIN